MMVEQLKDDIRLMASLASPTNEQLNTLLSEWDDYFQKMRIPESSQVVEFQGIMRARVMSGSISLVAPSI